MSDEQTPESRVGSNAELGEQKPERWERTYYNSYGNYRHYRFQDFRAQCEYRDDDHGGCNPSCANPEHPYATWEADYRECACDNCPMVEKDYDDEDPKEPDYSEGEQPILVLSPNTPFQATPKRSVGGRTGNES